MRDKIIKFMRGRYGMDSLNRMLLGIAVACAVVSLITGNDVFFVLGVIALAVSYLRMLSKNREDRSQENSVYLRYQSKVIGFWRKHANMLKQRKAYHIYHCPSCKQKIRIPRGKGRIVITCPKCKAEFRKKS
jgi:hypothetical protein